MTSWGTNDWQEDEEPPSEPEEEADGSWKKKQKKNSGAQEYCTHDKYFKEKGKTEGCQLTKKERKLAASLTLEERQCSSSRFRNKDLPEDPDCYGCCSHGDQVCMNYTCKLRHTYHGKDGLCHSCGAIVKAGNATPSHGYSCRAVANGMCVCV